jgi:ribosomal protein L4
VPNFEMVGASTVNTYQILRYKNVLFTRGALEALEARLKAETEAESTEATQA